MKNVYLDNAATTPLRNSVCERMQESLTTHYGNPSSVHSYGRSAKTQIEKARKTIAKYINASSSEIIFTSGGTEADNTALRSAVRDLGVTHIITSVIEHHAVLHTIAQLQAEYQIKISYVQLQDCGSPDLDDLEKLLQADDTKKLVSLMHVNNEIGNLTDVHTVAILCEKHKAFFHSDAVQSVGHWEWDVQKTPIHFLAASAHKFHGPKGVGFIYIRKNIRLKSLIFGGEQERGFRAGTEAVHNIVGLEEALKCAYEHLTEERNYIRDLKQYFINTLKKHIPEISYNGSCEDHSKSTYTLVNICLPVDEEKAKILLFHLDINGIACSAGSACQSGSVKGSHVLRNILTEAALKKPSLRFSFSIYNTKAEIDYTISTLKAFINDTHLVS